MHIDYKVRINRRKGTFSFRANQNSLIMFLIMPNHLFPMLIKNHHQMIAESSQILILKTKKNFCQKKCSFQENQTMQSSALTGHVVTIPSSHSSIDFTFDVTPSNSWYKWDRNKRYNRILWYIPHSNLINDRNHKFNLQLACRSLFLWSNSLSFVTTCVL